MNSCTFSLGSVDCDFREVFPFVYDATRLLCTRANNVVTIHGQIMQHTRYDIISTSQL